MDTEIVALLTDLAGEGAVGAGLLFLFYKAWNWRNRIEKRIRRQRNEIRRLRNTMKSILRTLPDEQFNQTLRTMIVEIDERGEDEDDDNDED